MRLNDGKFRDNGGCGYLLKPSCLRNGTPFHPDSGPFPPGKMTLTVQVGGVERRGGKGREGRGLLLGATCWDGSTGAHGRLRDYIYTWYLRGCSSFYYSNTAEIIKTPCEMAEATDRDPPTHTSQRHFKNTLLREFLTTGILCFLVGMPAAGLALGAAGRARTMLLSLLAVLVWLARGGREGGDEGPLGL